MMMQYVSAVYFVIGMLVAILSNYTVVCDVDPSDINSILLEQLKIQKYQLALDEDIQNKQSKQLDTQRKQIELLQQILLKTDYRTPVMEILVSVSCTALGFVALIFLRRFVTYLYIRYNIRPEMPQTNELMDFAAMPNEPLRSVRIGMKSPTDYQSCESDEG